MRWLLALLMLATPALAGISGPARVSDGDTLVIGEVKIRLHGIDAPELRQTCATRTGTWPCGAAARDRLSALTAKRTVTCDPRDTDRYGRTVARCSVGGQDLGAILVSEGLAWAFTRYSEDYVTLESAARDRRLGLWQSPTETAADYRADHKPAPSCAIKGNISGSGAHIYHLPGTPGYARVAITPSRGERWFCTTAEAEAAGWRPVFGK